MEGIIPALITPLHKDYSIDEKGLTELINHIVNAGVHGILVGGSTGEYTLMNEEERKRLFELAVKAADGRIPIIAGTGCHGTQTTIELTKYAEAVGVDAALVITPHYLKPTSEGLVTHYKMVAASVDIPIIIYNWPGATGICISLAAVEELSKVDNIAAIKNTAPQEHTNLLIQRTLTQKHFNVMTGWETLLLPTLACGGTGCIGVAYNVLPELSVAMYNAVVKENDFQKARVIHNKLVPFFDAIFSEPSPGPIKTAVEMVGWAAGPVRLPLLPISEGLKRRLKTILEELNVI